MAFFETFFFSFPLDAAWCIHLDVTKGQISSIRSVCYEHRLPVELLHSISLSNNANTLNLAGANSFALFCLA